MSRWNAGKDLSFELLSPTLVVEAAFEHLQGRRLRHTARFRQVAVPTGTRRAAPTTSSTWPSRPCWPTSSAPVASV